MLAGANSRVMNCGSALQAASLQKAQGAKSFQAFPLFCKFRSLLTTTEPSPPQQTPQLSPSNQLGDPQKDMSTTLSNPARKPLPSPQAGPCPEPPLQPRREPSLSNSHYQATAYLLSPSLSSSSCLLPPDQMPSAITYAGCALGVTQLLSLQC